MSNESCRACAMKSRHLEFLDMVRALPRQIHDQDSEGRYQRQCEQTLVATGPEWSRASQL